MSSNLEFALLSSIIDASDFHSVIRAKIVEDFFTSPECREVFRFINETFHANQTTGLVPSRELVQMRFPGFYFAPAYDAVPVLCQELKREKTRMDLLALSNELLLTAERDPLSAMALLRQETIRIAAMQDNGEDLSMANAVSILRDRYNAVQDAHGILGIPYPWEQLNEETQGMQPGQFIVLYGRPKSMKSWLAVNIGVHAYVRARRRVLFFTREMGSQEVARRVAACICKIDYKNFKNGKLQPTIKEQVFTLLSELADDERAVGELGKRQPYFIITSDRSTTEEAGGVSWLQSKIRDLQPDLVIVDGMYLMKDDRSAQRTVDWRQIAHISQDLKLTAQQYQIPVIGVTQANRAAEKTQGDDLTELAFSDSLGQDADAVFRVTLSENSETQRTELFLTAPGLREGKFSGIKIRGEPASSFEYLSSMAEHMNTKREKDYGGKPSRPAPNGASFRTRTQTYVEPKLPS